MEFDQDKLIDMYEKMLLARYFEEEVQKQYKSGQLYGRTHLAIGQEASAIGAGAALNDKDYVTLTHRGHIQALGAGVNPDLLMAELFGKESGPGGGKGGTIHFLDPKDNVLGENGVAGAGFSIACGAALTQKLKNTNNVVLCFGGDGAVDEGNFHEALNLAAIWKLPVVFFIENNLYARSTPLEEHSSILNLSERANAYNIPGITIDGNDVLETYGMTKLALEFARRGEGPVLIEAQTYRISPHENDDEEYYRTESEVDAWKDEDPIPKMADYLINNNIADPERLYQLEQSARRRIAAALLYAQESQELQPEDLTKNVYA